MNLKNVGKLPHTRVTCKHARRRRLTCLNFCRKIDIMSLFGADLKKNEKGSSIFLILIQSSFLVSHCSVSRCSLFPSVGTICKIGSTQPKPKHSICIGYIHHSQLWQGNLGNPNVGGAMQYYIYVCISFFYIFFFLFFCFCLFYCLYGMILLMLILSATCCFLNMVTVPLVCVCNIGYGP